MSHTVRITLVLGVVIAAALLLLAGPAIAGAWSIQFFQDDTLNGIARYQLYALAVAAAAALAVRAMEPGAAAWLRWGDLQQPAARERWLGINGRSSWLVNGAQLFVVVSLATATFMFTWRSGAEEPFQWQIDILPVVLLFSLSNALNEELIFRFALVAGLHDRLSPRTIMVLSAVLFGLPHYFGHPSGIIGVGMAGFLGYVLCKATLETKGLGVALVTHLMQDVIIFTALLM